MRDPTDSLIIHTHKIPGFELTKTRNPPSSWLSTGQGPTTPLSAYQYALAPNLYLKLFRVANVTTSLFASDWTTGKASSSSPGSQAIKSYQATKPLTNLRKQLPPRKHHHPFPAQQVPDDHGIRELILACLRLGLTPLLKAYANLSDPAADHICQLCNKEPQTMEH